MFNAGPHTNSSRFFIALKQITWLNGTYIVFGEVLVSKNVIKPLKAIGLLSDKIIKIEKKFLILVNLLVTSEI